MVILQTAHDVVGASKSIRYQLIDPAVLFVDGLRLIGLVRVDIAAGHGDVACRADVRTGEGGTRSCAQGDRFEGVEGQGVVGGRIKVFEDVSAIDRDLIAVH